MRWRCKTASGARPQLAGSGSGAGRVTKRARERQAMRSAPAFEAAGWGETPITQCVGVRGLRRKQCCQMLLGALVHSPRHPGREKGTKSAPPAGKHSCLWLHGQGSHSPALPWSVSPMTTVNRHFRRGACRVCQAERCEQKGHREKEIKCVSLKMGLLTQMPKYMKKSNAGKDSKINSWNMNSLQMKVISWTGRSRHLLMQKLRG